MALTRNLTHIYKYIYMCVCARARARARVRERERERFLFGLQTCLLPDSMPMSQKPLLLFRKVFTLGDATRNGISRLWVLGLH